MRHIPSISGMISLLPSIELRWEAMTVSKETSASTYISLFSTEKIYSVAGFPEYRSRGLATEFFEWLKSDDSIMRLRLEVEDYNEGAKRLYERMGFELLPYLQMVIDRQRKGS